MDRISSLPDEVLSHILCFLPTKYAALTSVLAKRWINLWKLVPNLNIDDTEFLHPEQGKSERVEIRQSFIDFMDNVLALRGDTTIEKFTLKCITGIHPDCVNRWIGNVLGRGVSDVDLNINFSEEDDEEEDGYHMYLDTFVSNTLANLKIRSEDSVISWYGDMYQTLPMLKSLYIDSDFIFFGEIDTSLPYYTELEELRMANMKWKDLGVTISSSSLRKLIINGTSYEDMENPKSFSFDTPNLIYLRYSDVVAEDYPLVNMEKLLTASIDLIVTDDHINQIRAPNNGLLEDNEDEEGNVVLKFSNVVKLMNGIQNVRTLTLHNDTLEVLSMCCDLLPVFNNLIVLGITSDKDRGWQALPALLRKFPKLQAIIIDGLSHQVTDKCGDACNCIAREDKGSSLKSSPVKIIEIHGFRATMKEMLLIKHFLDYFPSLKLMRIYIEENDPTPLKNREVSKLILEMIDLYNKSSSCDVQLLVSDYLDKKWKEEGIR